VFSEISLNAARETQQWFPDMLAREETSDAKETSHKERYETNLVAAQLACAFVVCGRVTVHDGFSECSVVQRCHCQAVV
jgi:hypothetical protein